MFRAAWWICIPLVYFVKEIQLILKWHSSYLIRAVNKGSQKREVYMTDDNLIF